MTDSLYVVLIPLSTRFLYNLSVTYFAIYLFVLYLSSLQYCPLGFLPVYFPKTGVCFSHVSRAFAGRLGLFLPTTYHHESSAMRDGLTHLPLEGLSVMSEKSRMCIERLASHTPELRIDSCVFSTHIRECVGSVLL